MWKKLDSKKTIIAIGNMVINQVMMMMVIIIHADIGDDDDDDFENNRCWREGDPPSRIEILDILTEDLPVMIF